MKHSRMIAILLALCILASLTACMPSDPDRTEPETSQTTTAPTTTVPPTTTEPGPKTLHLKDYVTGIDTSVINDDTIITLLRHAETILQEYDVIIIEDSYEMKHFARHSFKSTTHGNLPPEEIVVTLDRKGSEAKDPDCLITIYTDKISDEQHEGVRYMVMAALALQEYQNCYYNDERDYYDGPYGQNGFYYGVVYISPAYIGSGYDTVKDFFTAVRDEEYSLGDAGAYRIAVRGIDSLRLYPIYTPIFYTLDQLGLQNYYKTLLPKAFPEE